MGLGGTQARELHSSDGPSVAAVRYGKRLTHATVEGAQANVSSEILHLQAKWGRRLGTGSASNGRSGF